MEEYGPGKTSVIGKHELGLLRPEQVGFLILAVVTPTQLSFGHVCDLQ